MAQISPQRYRDKAAECRHLAKVSGVIGDWLNMAREWDDMAKLADNMATIENITGKIKRELGKHPGRT
jgi:hypothetical protein